MHMVLDLRQGGIGDWEQQHRDGGSGAASKSAPNPGLCHRNTLGGAVSGRNFGIVGQFGALFCVQWEAEVKA